MFALSKTRLLCCHLPKKNKNVLLYSIMHNDGIDEETGDQYKRQVVTFYILTKGGVEVVDLPKSDYDVSRISCRWPFTISFALLINGTINKEM